MTTPRLTHLDLAAVRRLLRASVRHTEIARSLNLAVGTISRIASDRRLRRRKLELLGEADLPEDDAPPEYVASNLRRCPTCGGMVYQWPCLACRMRGHAGEGEAREGEAPAEPPAGPTGRPTPAQAAGLGHGCDECDEPQRGDTTIRLNRWAPLPTQGCALG
jgi:hypothetical protein